MPRIAAALVALSAWAGLAVQSYASFTQLHDALATAWVLLRYFTIITNLIVAVVMTAVAMKRRVSPTILAGVTLAILLVGVVYALLLQHLYHLTGPDHVADILLHKVTPALMTLWWLLFGPRGKLKWSAPLWWSAYPLTYFTYALARGQADGKYPYPFIDVGAIGWVQTGLNALGIAMAFVLTGLVMVWLDRWLPLGSRRSSR